MVLMVMMIRARKLARLNGVKVRIVIMVIVMIVLMLLFMMTIMMIMITNDDHDYCDVSLEFFPELLVAKEETI